MSLGSYAVAYLRASRWEYILAEIPGLFALFFIGASSLGRLLAPVVWEGVAVFVLLYFMGFMINAYTDQDIDRKYTIFKNKLPDAVELIGQRNMQVLIVAQIAAAFVITAHVAYVMNSWLPLALASVGTFFGVGYSIPPLKFKVRGWLHAVSLTVSAFFVPALFVLYTIAGTIALAPLVIVIGFSILHYGIAFANQAIDYMEDRANGVRSPPVLWGMETSLRVALGAMAVGLLVEFAGLYYLIVPGPVSVLGVNGVPLFALTVPIVLAGYYMPVSGLWKMHIATRNRPIADATRYMKEICRYNLWQASGIMGLMFATGILFLGAMVA